MAEQDALEQIRAKWAAIADGLATDASNDFAVQCIRMVLEDLAGAGWGAAAVCLCTVVSGGHVCRHADCPVHGPASPREPAP